MSQDVINNMSLAMDKNIQALQKDFLRLRTGRASTALVDGIHVDYYGANSPLNQVANVTTPDARTIQIAPWENSLLGAIEKAILAANIGLTPQSDGKIIRISIPTMTEERRKELVKTVKKMGEETKVAIRNHRRDANELIKKKEKDKQMSEDEAKKLTEQVQKKTDAKVIEVDKVVTGKEKEIMTI